MLEIWCRKDYLKMYTMPKWYKLLKLVFLNYFIVFPEGFWNRLKKTLNFSVVFRARSINPWPRISGFASQLYLTLFWYHSFYFRCGGQLSVHEELLHKRLSMSTSLVTFLLLPVTSAAVVGISHSMVLGVAPLIELMARSIYGNSSWAGKKLHRHSHIEGQCNNIHKGKVQMGFWVGNCNNGHALADAYTGWTTMSRIFIEEVARAQHQTWLTTHIPKDASDSKIVLLRDFKNILNPWTPPRWSIKV